MWVRSFETIENLRLALLAFKRTYNEQWMLAKYDYRESSPSATRFRRAGRGRVEVITVKPLSKNPGALHFPRRCEHMLEEDSDFALIEQA